MLTTKQDIRKGIMLPKACQLGNSKTTTSHPSKSATLYSQQEEITAPNSEEKSLEGKKLDDCKKDLRSQWHVLSF